MWGKSKKKLSLAQNQISNANQDIIARQGELNKLTEDIKSCDLDTQHIKSSVEKEKAEQTAVEAENVRLTAEIESANAEVAGFLRRIEVAKASAQEAKKDEEDLMVEVAKQEELVKLEHAAAEIAANTARREASNLQREQQTERTNWQTVRDAHEELRKQVEACQQQCEEAKANRDRVKHEWATTRDALRELQLSHGRLSEDYKRTEALVVEQKEQRVRLEDEIVSLFEKHKRVKEAHKVLEQDHRQRQFVLDSVTENLSDKRGQLQRELGAFQEQFEKAKAQHDQIVSENCQAQRDTLQNFSPEQFQPQTQQAGRGRVSNSYDPGFLPQIPAGAPMSAR